MNTVATADDDGNVTAYVTTAQNAIVLHALNGRTNNDTRVDENFFYGVMIDTVCVLARSGNLLQYRAYCRHVGEQENIDASKRVCYKLVITGKDSIGRATVKFPMNKITLKFNIHINDEYIPLLLSLADLDRLGIFYKNPANQPVHNEASKTTNVERL